MFKYIPDIISGFLVAREIGAAHQANCFWENAYNGKCNEYTNTMGMLKSEQELASRLREEVVIGHNNTMELMAQAQDNEKERHELTRAYMYLIQQIEELGFRVDDENNIVTPDDVEVEDLDSTGEEDEEEEKGLPEK